MDVYEKDNAFGGWSEAHEKEIQSNLLSVM